MRNTQPALTVHIAQFAALLRDRQVVIAFHERALFDYLTLELHRRRRPARQHDAVGPAPLTTWNSCSAAGSTGPAAPSPLRSGSLLKTDLIENRAAGITRVGRPRVRRRRVIGGIASKTFARVVARPFP